jgi:class 3 adenylate cyclase/tetratricopeptide (TPR) repeat protein
MPAMKCPKCQAENRETRKFCAECGAKLVIACPECGSENLPGEKFCGECGYDLRKPAAPSAPIDYSKPQSYTPKYLADKILTTRSSIEGERKLVTVLFADVANYTSIAEKLDPEEVHQLMDGCFKILMDEVHKYEGTINQFTGDGVMALLGAPLAHEDHAQRACHAALAIQKAMQGYGEKIRDQYGSDFKMRIGLNSGPVIVGSIGDDLRMDYTAVGDTTNLAHRMQDLANPGSVLVSGHTHRLARDFFEFASLGKVDVKGKEEPQEAYELLRPSEVETRIEAAAAKGLTRFVGRRKEMEALKEAFNRAQSGSGQVIGVVGEAGVGKSRLLLELRKAIPEGEYSFLEGRCLHYGGSMPYLPMRDILKGLFQIREGDLEAGIKEKVRECVCKLDDNVIDVPACLQELMSLRVEDERYLQLSPQQRRERTFEAIRDLLIRESQHKPLILAVEDLHWIDKTSHEFLDYLIGFLPTARVLLILLYRPEYTHEWGSKSYYGKIGLDQLSAQTSAELVQAILEGGDVAPEIAGLVLRRAGGNPLFVEELTHSLVENGTIQKKDHQFVLARKPSEIEVPDTIQGIIAARMDRIEDNLKRIMQVASVIGREFAYRILDFITGMREDLKVSLLNLQGLEFIYEKHLFPELEYIFKHALTQEVAYNSLLLKRRKEIHEKIGQAIERLYTDRLEEYYELLAYHYRRSNNKAKALEYLDCANRKAFRIRAMEEAKAYFEEAMNLLDSIPETEENRERRIALLSNQKYLFHLLLKMPEYHDLLKRYEAVAVGLDNPGLLGAFYTGLGGCEFIFGSFDKAIKTLDRAAELCEAAGNNEDAGGAYMLLEWSHLSRGDFEHALRIKKDVLRIMDRKFDLHTYMRSFCTASYAYAFLGRWDEAVQEGQEALRVAEEFSDNSHVSWSAWTLSHAYSHKGDLDLAQQYGELAVQRAVTPVDKAMAETTLAWAWCRSGKPSKGVEVFLGLLPIFRAVRHGPAELSGLLFLTEGYWLDNQCEEAKSTAQDLLAVAERCGARYHLGFAYRLLAEIALETKADEASPHFEQAISIFGEIKAEHELALAYSGMGRYHKQQGNVEEAREYLTKALEIFERLGTLIEPDKVRKELAELPT